MTKNPVFGDLKDQTAHFLALCTYCICTVHCKIFNFERASGIVKLYDCCETLPLKIKKKGMDVPVCECGKVASAPASLMDVPVPNISQLRLNPAEQQRLG